MIRTNDVPLAAHTPHQNLYPKHVSGLRSPGLLGRYPLIGLIMVVLGSVAFTVLAIDLETNGPFTQADTLLINGLHNIALRSSTFILGIMQLGFYIAQYGFILLGAILLLYFLYKRFWMEFSMVLIAWVGEGPLWYFLSAYFNRPRPTFEQSVWRQMTVPGFPSGHSLAAVMCFGLIAYLVLPKISSAFWKGMVIGLTIIAIFYIGFSRMFVGDHYPTDILAGYAIGLAWSGLVYTAVEWFARRRQQAKETTNSP